LAPTVLIVSLISSSLRCRRPHPLTLPMTNINNRWNSTTSLSSSVLPHALIEAAGMVWTEHTMPVTHALTAQGTLVNEVSWLPARSFQSDNNGAMSYALVKLPPSNFWFYSITYSSATVRQIMSPFLAPLSRFCGGHLLLSAILPCHKRRKVTLSETRTLKSPFTWEASNLCT
jgi:hypothetical protein